MQDHADRHVERWRDHWVLEEDLDDDVEAMTVRIGVVARYFRESTKRAVAEVGLTDAEYDTLHRLMIRDVPGHTSPGVLAHELGISNAGMTGRLDSMEEKGWLKRVPGSGDRRRVDVEATRSGVAIWRRAMSLRGTAEIDVAATLTSKELTTLNRLLRKMTLHVEGGEGA